jgi:hypothetical protein
MCVRECKRALKLEDMKINERPTKLRIHRSKVKDRVGSSQEFWAAAFCTKATSIDIIKQDRRSVIHEEKYAIQELDTSESV